MARIIIIPARLASERFPGKLLHNETGWPLLRYGYERCCQVPGARVVVAADGKPIADAVEAFGGECVLTDPDLPSGTDRVAAAAEALAVDPAQARVVNVQGDEPEIDPAHVELLFDLLEDSAADVATLATRRQDVDGFRNPNRVKVVRSETGAGLYFSRSPVPHVRELAAVANPDWLCHIGIYGFRFEALKAFSQRPASPLEQRERLEQLRFLEMGLRIQVGIVESAAAGIDTPEDYREFMARLRASSQTEGTD